VALKRGHSAGSYEYMNRVRERLNEEMPHLSTYFQSGGLADAVLNLGLPAPIDIQVSGSDLTASYQTARQIADKVRLIEGVSDVYIPQDLDYPALQVDIDRINAGQLGLTQKEIVQNMITALTSNQMIAPSYWVDHKSGNDYLLTVQYPEGQIRSLADLAAIPMRPPAGSSSARLGAVGNIRRIQSPTEVDHYQLRRVIDVYVSPAKEDLGRIAGEIDQLLEATELPEGVRVTLRGMVQGMRSSFQSFGMGLLLAVALLYLILVAQFRSFLDPFLVLTSLPMGLTGVLLALFFTDTTLNVMSLMGIVMLVGVAASNSILIIHTANSLRDEGRSVPDSIMTASKLRLRPVLMTSLATIVGLLPLAFKLGTGGEVYIPMARAIMGGMTLSVLTSVFVVPAAYLVAYRNFDRRRGLATAEDAR
jgi:multidrug efflux pump subunit AcrB